MNLHSISKGPVLCKLLAVTVTLLVTVPAIAVNHIQLGAVGVAFGQSVRFHVVNLTPPDPNIPPGPCRVQLALLDLGGKPVNNARGLPAVQEGSIDPGQSLTLLFSNTGLARFGGRLIVRGQITLTSDSALPPGPCSHVIPSLEVTDDFSARTEAYVSPGEIAGFNPQPDPPGDLRLAFEYGLVGIAFGQQARLHVVSVPTPATVSTNADVQPGPCRVTLSFLSASGESITKGKGIPVTEDVEVNPGGFAELTLNSIGLVPLGRRLLIRAQVTSPTDTGVPPGPCRAFTSDLEIVDDFSARTSHFISPAEIHGFNPQPDPPAIPVANVP